MKTALKYLLIYFGLSIVGAILFAFPVVLFDTIVLNNSAAMTDDVGLDMWSQITILIGSQLLPLFLFWKNKWCNYSLVKEQNTSKIFLWAAIGCIGVMLVLSTIQVYLPHFEWELDLMKDLGDMLKNPLGIISACILAPLLEEGIFRGTIERKLLETGKKPWVAIVISAVAFAIAHLNFTQGVTALIIGLFLGWIYYRTHNIWYCIFVHALNNLISTIMFIITNDASCDSPFSLPVNLLLLVVGAGLTFFVVKQVIKLTHTGSWVPEVLAEETGIPTPPPLSINDEEEV